MNLVKFDNDLAGSLGDRESNFYSGADRLNASMQAAIEYSKYRPFRRRFGTGRLFTSMVIGDTSIIVVGGPFKQNDVLTLEPYNGNSEQLTVQSVIRGGDSAIQLDAVTRVTFTAPCAFDHSIGALITPTSPGLTINPNQDWYELPPDWRRPDQATFDMAIGAKAAVKRGDSYYDAVYVFSNQLSGVGAGYQMLSGPMYRGLYPIAGDPFQNPNGMMGRTLVNQPTTFRFEDGEPPLLNVTPVPASGKTLDFFYLGSHTFDTLPREDANAIMSYAKYVCHLARASRLGSRMNYSEDDTTENPSQNADSLQKLAEFEFQEFQRAIIDRPYVSSG